MESKSRPLTFDRMMMMAVAIAFATASHTTMNAQPASTPTNKVLFVLTSHDRIEKTGKPTGFYLSEVTHPWEVLVNAGYEIDFVSPQGGKAPVDGFDLTDPINRKFWDDATYRRKIEHTQCPAEIDPGAYVAIHFAGGHGAMWDLADNAALADIAANIYQNGGVVSAVCHGPAGLVNIKLSSGKYLVDGKKVNAFTNEEEAEVHLDDVVPFLLESKLIERGAIFEKSAPWQSHAVADQRLVTGQNPHSAGAVGKAVLNQLENREVIGRLTRFVAKPNKRESIQMALSDYVSRALAEQTNLQAEACYEREDRSVLWLIERWRNRSELERFGRDPRAAVVASLDDGALQAKPDVHIVTDLGPLTREQWRRAPDTADRALIVMLFVDAKEGTQHEFKATYRTALPAFRDEPGVVTYQLSQLENDETKFVTYEKFRSDEAFAYHLNFPAIRPVIDFLHTSIKKQPFQDGLHTLIEFAPLLRE